MEGVNDPEDWSPCSGCLFYKHLDDANFNVTYCIPCAALHIVSSCFLFLRMAVYRSTASYAEYMDAKADLVKTEPKLRATIQQAEGKLRAKKHQVERLRSVASSAGSVCPLVRKDVSHKIICSKYRHLLRMYRSSSRSCLARMKKVKC